MHEVGVVKDNSSHLKGKSKDLTLVLNTSRINSVPSSMNEVAANLSLVILSVNVCFALG